MIDEAEDPNPYDKMWFCTRCEIYHIQNSDMPEPTSEMKKASRLSMGEALTCEETQVLVIQEE